MGSIELIRCLRVLPYYAEEDERKSSHDANPPDVEAKMERALSVCFRENVQGLLPAASAAFRHWEGLYAGVAG